MKNRILKTLAIVGLMTAISITTASAYARTRVTAYIPFDFVAGEKTLPAGEYTIKNASRHLQDALRRAARDAELRELHEGGARRRAASAQRRVQH